MPNIIVVPKDPQFASAFDEAYRSQLPFATAVAVTRVGNEAAAAVSKRVKQHWNVRSKGLPKLPRGLRGDKRDWPRITGGVYVRQDIGEAFTEHEFGAARKPKGNTITVPTRYFRGQRGASGKLPKTRTPRAMLSSKKGKWAASKTERRIVLKKSVKGDGRRIAFIRTEEARIDPGLRANRAADSAVAKNYQAHFEREMRAAIKSRRAQQGRFSSQLGRDLYVVARRQSGRIPGF